MKGWIVTVAALCCCVALEAQQTKNFIDQPYVEVNGRAEMEVVPDEIYLRIVITEKDNKGKVSVEQQQQSMIKALKAAGIEVDKALSVADMSSDLQSFFLRKDAVLATKTFQLKVNSAEQLAKVFQALQSTGVSDVNLTRTTVSNLEELQQQVRREAAQNAQKDAQVLAEAIGQKIRQAIYIQDFGFNTPRALPVMFAKSAAVANDELAEGAAPPLEFQKIKIEHSVLIRFTLW